MKEKPLSQKYESKLLTCELLGAGTEEPSVVFVYGIPSNADLICPFLKECVWVSPERARRKFRPCRERER